MINSFQLSKSGRLSSVAVINTVLMRHQAHELDSHQKFLSAEGLKVNED